MTTETDETEAGQIQVEVVLAMPQRQLLVSVSVDEGSTLADAIACSGISEQFEDFEIDPAKVGIFGRKASMDQVLRNGDRVEIYRALIADPKKIRRERALEQAKT